MFAAISQDGMLKFSLVGFEINSGLYTFLYSVVNIFFLEQATKEKIALEEEHRHKCNNIQRTKDRVMRLERQIKDIDEMTMRSTQVLFIYH